MLFSAHLQNGDAASHDLSENPFLPVLAEIASSSASSGERELVADLVLSGVKNAGGQTVRGFSLASKPAVAKASVRLQAAMSAYLQREEGFDALVGMWKQAAVGRLVVVEGDEAAANHHAAGSALLFEPRWIRPAPPRCDVETGELVWIDMDSTPFELLWDASMGTEESAVAEVRDLLATAFREPLQPEAQARLLELVVEVAPAGLAQSGFVPNRLAELIESNPTVAIELLLKLMSNSSAEISEFLAVLVRMLTPQSMEVVSRLTMSVVDIPPEFIRLYITNCISACKSLNGDKFNQNRLVRLVSIFLQSLLRNHTIDVLDLQAEVQGFCLEFSKVKEATTLFRMLKSSENDEK